MLFTSRQLLAADAAPEAAVTIPPSAGAPVPLPALQPLSRAPQRCDPDAPIQPVPQPLPALSASAARTGEGEWVAAEIVVASLVMTGLGVGGHFALAYQPTYETIPMSTTASTTLNLTGIVALLAAPGIAGRLVCGIGRLSSSYEGLAGGLSASPTLESRQLDSHLWRPLGNSPPTATSAPFPGLRR
jgi:hypothetical protein